MKQFYLITLLSFIFVSAFAVPKTLKVNKGNIDDELAWDPIGVPANGDLLIVPANYTLVVSKQVNLSSHDINLIIDGVLDLNNGKLSLGPESSIYLSSSAAKIISEKGNASDKINIGGSEKYDGKNGTIVGPAIADKTTANTNSSSINQSGFQLLSFDAILPVRFLGFSVANTSNGVSVQWSTAEEINADVFQVERSEGGRTWRTVGSVKAVGNATNVNSYAFTDKTILNNIAYYRIRQVDIDGKFTYTEVKTVVNKVSQANTINNVTAYVSNEDVVINFSKEVKSSVVVKLISFSGQVLAQQTYTQPSTQIIFSQTVATRGNYILLVSDNLELKVAKQIRL